MCALVYMCTLLIYYSQLHHCNVIGIGPDYVFVYMTDNIVKENILNYIVS